MFFLSNSRLLRPTGGPSSLSLALLLNYLLTIFLKPSLEVAAIVLDYDVYDWLITEALFSYVHVDEILGIDYLFSFYNFD